MSKKAKTESAISNPTKGENLESTYVLGSRIDKVSFDEALAFCKFFLESRKKGYIVTPNPEIVVIAERDKILQEIINRSDLSIPDGMGMVVLSKIFGDSIPSRVAGADLLSGLAGLGEEFGFNVFLLGAGEGVAERAAANLKQRYPRLKIAGTFAGDGSEAGDRETLRKIGKQQIDILAVAYGPGKQERWIRRNLSKTGVHLAIGVGGALGFVSGDKRRAPVWMQKMGTEWLFRLAQEPWRLKRQLALPEFAIKYVIERLKKASR